MSQTFCPAFLVATIGALTILSSAKIDAQSTVDDSASCELDESVNIIRKDLNDVKRICASFQQHTTSAVDTTSLGEYIRYKL